MGPHRTRSAEKMGVEYFTNRRGVLRIDPVGCVKSTAHHVFPNVLDWCGPDLQHRTFTLPQLVQWIRKKTTMKWRKALHV